MHTGRVSGPPTARGNDILLRFVRGRALNPYGEGFWSERFKFLDYTGSRFLEVQERLLLEQLDELGSSPAAGLNVPGERGTTPRSLARFLRSTPLTSVDDYAAPLNSMRQSQSGKSYTWAYTLYGPGREKWVPYTQRGLKVFTDNVMGVIGLSSAATPGQADIQPGDRAIYNIPPRPFLAGIGAFELGRRFGLKGVIDPDVAERLEFKERIQAEFNVALGTGVDILISMTTVLKRVSERFGEGFSSHSGPSGGSRGVRAAARYMTALSKAKLAGRSLKPGDLWKPKSIVGWGLDTRHFRQEIASDWGRPPFELYASTEVGCMGLQYGADRGIALNPEVCFFEFLPETEIDAMRRDPEYTPRTALLPDVSGDGRYEVVITSFNGMPYLRYRTGHMVKFSGGHLGYGPDLEFVGRADDLIDIAGFTRIDEATIWKAVASSGAGLRDWILRREVRDGQSVLSMYAEPTRLDGPPEGARAGAADPGPGATDMEERLHAALVKSDPLYADLASMLGWRPLKINVLSPGTFDLYYEEMRKAGAGLMSRKPRRINAPDETLDRLLGLSRELGRRKAA